MSSAAMSRSLLQRTRSNQALGNEPFVQNSKKRDSMELLRAGTLRFRTLARLRRRNSFWKRNPLTVAPEVVEIVKTPRLRLKDVYYDTRDVEQNPPA